MVFSSLLFLFRFLPLALFAYYIAPKKMRNLVLFIASLIFYAWGEPVYVVLILFSTLVDYITGRAAAHYRAQGQLGRARIAVFASAFINLALLSFFKYSGFFLQTVCSLCSIKAPVFRPKLPIGISFYTFQTMSYTIDVYRGDASVQKNFIAFGAYVSLFPQLIAGPIVRYKSVAKQLNSRKETVDLFFYGIVRFSAGLGKKVLIANEIGAVWNEIAAISSDQLAALTAWLGIAAYSLQIYFDFSGYSDMAIGLGAMFGFHFTENFNYPYESKTITEFWRRWHISLGTWFREYVYIPLGGNRKGLVRQMLHIAIVWFLTGLWHGAYWNFVLWGLYYGILLVFEKFFLLRHMQKIPGWCAHCYTIVCTLAGMCLFSYQDMPDGAGYLQALIFQSGAGCWNAQTIYLALSNAGLFLIAVIGCTSFPKQFVLKQCLPCRTETDFVKRDIASILYTAAMLAASVAMLVNSSYNPFLYFRF